MNDDTTKQPPAFGEEASAKAREMIDLHKSIYRREFLEDDRWKILAKEAGIHLPPFYTRPSDTAIKSTLRRLRVPWDYFLDAFGWEDSAHFERLNPSWSLRPLTGLILELWEEKNMMRDACRSAAEGRGMRVGEAELKKIRLPKGTAKGKRAPLQKPDPATGQGDAV